jgi:ribosome-associated protein
VTSDKLARLCAKLASEKKATDIVAIDLREISGFTDYFVICSGSSEPQLKAILGEVRDKLKEEHGRRPLAVDGFPMSQWVVLDYGDVVIHIFHENKRAFYAIEDLWGDAPRLRLRLTQG